MNSIKNKKMKTSNIILLGLGVAYLLGVVFSVIGYTKKYDSHKAYLEELSAQLNKTEIHTLNIESCDPEWSPRWRRGLTTQDIIFDNSTLPTRNEFYISGDTLYCRGALSVELVLPHAQTQIINGVSSPLTEPENSMWKELGVVLRQSLPNN